MLSLFAIWPALFLLVMGCGLLTVSGLQRIGGRSFCRPLGTAQTFWLGYGALIVIFQAYSLVLPTRAPLLVALSVLAAAGFYGSRQVVWGRLRSWLRRPRWLLAMAALTLAVAVSIASRAVLPVTWYDTHLYHLQVVKWARAYAAVPGIGNLHFRLAYNNSVHLFDALVDVFARGRAAHVSRGFLTTVQLVQLLAMVSRVGHARARLAGAFALVMVPFLLSRAYLDDEIQSLSTDLPMVMLIISVFAELLVLPLHGRRVNDLQLTLVVLLSAVAVTTKLGAVPVFLVAAWAVCSSIGWRNLLSRRAAVVFCLPGLAMLGYAARQVLLSGWLFFPTPAGNLHLSWSLPLPIVLDQYAWIESWARMPGRGYGEVLGRGFFHWFTPWYAVHKNDVEILLLKFALAVGLFRLASPRSARVAYERAALVAALLGIAFWFHGAPDLRFGRGFFWLALATSLAPLLGSATRTPTGRALALGLLVYASVWAKGFELTFPEGDALTRLPAIPKIAVTRKRVSPELEVETPDGTDRCSNAPIPCTPFPAPFQLRRAGDYGSGFRF